MEKRFPEIYNFSPERLGIHFKDKFVLKESSSGYPIKQGYNQLDNFKKLIMSQETSVHSKFGLARNFCR